VRDSFAIVGVLEGEQKTNRRAFHTIYIAVAIRLLTESCWHIAGRAVAIDYMKARYESGKPKEPPGANVPKVLREPKKLNLEWDK